MATVSYQYMPEITINRALMDTLSEQEREDFVKASPTPVFRYNNITKQVLAHVPSSVDHEEHSGQNRVWRMTRTSSRTH